jgi:hypothetical protein
MGHVLSARLYARAQAAMMETEPRRRIAVRRVLLGLLAALPLTGCAGFFQNVYDEQAEAECEAIIDVDARRACLNALAEEQLARD